MPQYVFLWDGIESNLICRDVLITKNSRRCGQSTQRLRGYGTMTNRCQHKNGKNVFKRPILYQALNRKKSILVHW